MNEYIAKNQTAVFQNSVIQNGSSAQHIRTEHIVKLPTLSIGKKLWGQ